MISTNYTINNTTATRKWMGIAGAFITLVIPYILVLQHAGDHIESDQSFCPFKMLTGFPCPGCGITKSLVFLFEGDMAKSFSYHLFGPFLVLFCLLTIAVLATELITGQTYFRKIVYSQKLAWGLAGVLAVYHLSRLVYFVSTNNIQSILQQSVWQ